MKLTPAQKRVLAKVMAPGYSFQVKNFPPGFVASAYVPPHYLTGKAFGANLGREKTWNTTLKKTRRD